MYQLAGPQLRSRTDTLKVERTFLECYITECIRLELFDVHESKLAEVLTAMCLRFKMICPWLDVAFDRGLMPLTLDKAKASVRAINRYLQRIEDEAGSSLENLSELRVHVPAII